jgi:hypothetical protein
VRAGNGCLACEKCNGNAPNQQFFQGVIMRYVFAVLVAMTAAALFSVVTGCSTDQPGATNTMGSYSTNVAAAPDKVTTAASKACEDLKLANINSSGTRVDGKVTAQTAQGEEVAINIEQAGDNVSKVTIRVGATGDEAVSKQIVDRIKSHLGWF